MNMLQLKYYKICYINDALFLFLGPDSEKGRKPCVAASLYIGNNKWSNMPCAALQRVMCKAGLDDLKPTEQPITTSKYLNTLCDEQNPNDGWILGPSNNICYHVTSEGRNWLDSETFCRSKGGHLVSIHSPEENSYILSLTYDQTKKTWLGLSTVYTGSNFEWVDDSPFNFSFWDENGKRKTKLRIFKRNKLFFIIMGLIC